MFPKYIKGKLGHVEKMLLEAHLSDCGRCSERLDDFIEAALDSGEVKLAKAPFYPSLDIHNSYQKFAAAVSREIQAKAYVTLIATYILKRPYTVRRRQRGAPVKNRLMHQNEEFRWEIRRDRDTLVLSIAAKGDLAVELAGTYVCVGIPSASKADYPSGSVLWVQDGPDRIASVGPISPGGRIDIELAETCLDPDREEDYRILERIFREVELEIVRYGNGK
jgi:hypothetical protein